MQVSKTAVKHENFKPFNIVLTVENNADIHMLYCITRYAFICQALESTCVHENADDVFDCIYAYIKKLVEADDKSEEAFNSFDEAMKSLVS